MAMPTILVDLIIGILCRLPVKSLLRFRCLSKQFRSMIDSPDFIKRHLNASKEINSNRSLIAQPNGGDLSIIDLNSADFSNATKVLDPPFNDNFFNPCFSIIGYCDGLVALSASWSRYHCPNILLWNISTKKYQNLRNFSIRCDEDVKLFKGFGYDVTSDDYKLVYIKQNRNYNLNEVIVYSLKAETSRKRTENSFDLNSFRCTYKEATYVAGALNWIGKRKFGIDKYRYLIISFDLESEKFCEVSIPDIGNYDTCNWDLGINSLGGCLCIICRYSSEFVFDIWVMKEYGMRESWTKLFSFSYFNLFGNIMDSPEPVLCSEPTIISLVYSNHVGKILVFLSTGKVLQHDLKKEKDESVEINGWPPCTCILNATVYVDSLVSPIGSYMKRRKRKIMSKRMKR